MRLIVCDRCDRKITPESKLVLVKVERDGVIKDAQRDAAVPVELCEICLRDLRQFLAPLPKAVQAEGAA